MKDTLQNISIILITFLLAMATSALFDVDWVNGHWLRQSLVVLLIVLQLVTGALVFYFKVKTMVGRPKKKVE